MTSIGTASPHLRAVGRDSGITMLRQSLAMGLAFINSIVLARVLGPEGKGIYSVALLLPSTATALLNLGIAPATVYYVAKGDFQAGRAVSNSVKIGLVLSTAAMAVSALVTAFASDALFPGVPETSLYVSLLYIPFSLVALYLLSIVQGLQDFRTYNLIAISTQVSALLMTFLLVWVLDMGVNGALLALPAGYFSGIMASSRALRTRSGRAKRQGLRFDPGYLRKVLPYGLTAHVSNVITFLNSHVDLFLVNLFLFPGEAGIYTLAIGLAERLSIVSSSASTVILPRISELEGSEGLRQQITPIVTRHVLAVTLVLSLLGTALSTIFVSLVYGPAFQRAAAVFRALLPSTITLSISRVLSSDIAGRGRPQVNARISAIQMVVSVALDMLLIPTYGIIGAAVATSVATTGGALIKLGYYSRTSGVPWKRLLVLDVNDMTRLARVVRTQSIGMYGRGAGVLVKLHAVVRNRSLGPRRRPPPDA